MTKRMLRCGIAALCLLGSVAALAGPADAPAGGAPAGAGPRGPGGPGATGVPATGVPATGMPATGMPPGMRLGWQTQLGVGAIVNPEYVGSDEYQFIPIPYFEFRYLDERGTLFFANVPQGIGGYFYRRREPDGRTFNLGAALAPGFNVRGDEIEGLQEVDPAVEARLLLEAGSRRWGFQATLAQDVGNGHEGAYLDVSLSRQGRIGSRGGFYAVGPVLRIGDDAYKDTLFSVTEAESATSGLPAYEAEASLERFGVQALVSLPVGKGPWRFTAIGRASRLFDEAAESPVVVEENQFFFLTALTRTF
ncbi:MAG: MipA/OmpV family protein [Pseudomonadales bacterium]|jgi:outer membrane scaffolding protein for murein synthesis (MipA/OmpV family)|nr:MipA/OmpV family protein [Pseudomonadales bacterium]